MSAYRGIPDANFLHARPIRRRDASKQTANTPYSGHVEKTLVVLTKQGTLPRAAWVGLVTSSIEDLRIMSLFAVENRISYPVPEQNLAKNAFPELGQLVSTDMSQRQQRGTSCKVEKGGGVRLRDSASPPNASPPIGYLQHTLHLV